MQFLHLYSMRQFRGRGKDLPMAGATPYNPALITLSRNNCGETLFPILGHERRQIDGDASGRP
jgi:hypothetical protein